MKHRNITCIFSCIFLLFQYGCFAQTDAKNRIKNPSFEIGTGNWEFSAWQSEGADKERHHKKILKVNPQDGDYYCELAGNSGYKLYQRLEVVSGESYLLSFYAQARPSVSREESRFNVLVDGELIATILPPEKKWEKFSFSVKAQKSGQMKIAFEDLKFGHEGIGAMLDMVGLFKNDKTTAFITDTVCQSEVYNIQKAQIPKDKKFVSLFNGENFSGWNGNENWFRIEEQVIVAGKLNERIPHNYFLATDAEFYNFEMHLDFKTVGEQSINGGVQIRSKRVAEHFEMAGYQVDIIPDGRSGLIYDESRRKIFLNEKLITNDDPLVKKGEWNHFCTICKDARIVAYLNGYLISDYIELDEKIMKQSGVIGLQIHGGPPAEISYRNIVIKRFSE